ncbi:MAG: DUF1905 domain-containing protein [Bacteroidetes bacterium]|nr:DUF1905 domain-containing protein [Bacteroidota bacterium]
MEKFTARLELIGINPFVFIPETILKVIFGQSGKSKGPIPIRGTVNGKNYIQTLVKYSGEWRLYINTTILKDSPKRIGEEITVTVEYDPFVRTIKPHPKLVKVLTENKSAKNVFDGLALSKKKEIIRYVSFLKSEESISNNIEKVIGFLNGENSFLGQIINKKRTK